MRYRYLTCLCAGLVWASAAAQAGTVDVAFVQPQAFTDVLDADLNTTANLQAISDYLQRLGKDYLPDGQSLKVEVLNVDLAGKLRPTRRWGLVRVTGLPLDWPRMTLRYTLESDGKVLTSGEETLSDMGYSSRLGAYAGQEPLAYEKRMLKDWFRSRFVNH